MEDNPTVNYFLFNDRKSTLRCSFILVALLLYSNSILVLLAFHLFSTPNTTLSHFKYSLFLFHFTLILQQFLPLLFFISNLFILHSRPLFFSNHLQFHLVYPLLFLNKKSFSTPPQPLCVKGMATLSCNSNDIAPQKQCNY